MASHEAQLVYLGMCFSILSRSAFVVVIYRNRSINLITLTACTLTVGANAFWIPYAVHIGSAALLVRSVIDAALCVGAGALIVHNRICRTSKQEFVTATTVVK
ncbi:hypothetical protein EBZ80_18385 [bacterium]|nr:hypothetical protein [bacterium]